MDQELLPCDTGQPNTEEKPKRTRKPKGPTTEELLDRIEKLEACLAKIATLSGNANHLREFGLKRWEPSKSDMRKY